MEESDLAARLLPGAFVSSFIGRARPGDLSDPDPARRAAAWAHWSVSAFAEMKGLSDRSYTALVLPGRFYDPKGTGPQVRPHLEVPARVLNTSDPEFPDRLGQAGNGLTFPWWLVMEVTAVRRSLFNTAPGSVGELCDALNSRRLGLVDALARASSAAATSWSVVEGLLVSSPDGLSGDATSDFSTDEVAALFPPARDLDLSVVFDAKLRDSNKQWASRRLGVWQLVGGTGRDRFSLGVITPRLTANSLFRDPHFSPDRESPAALLVRTLLLRRLLRNHLGGCIQGAVAPGLDARPVGGPHLRAVAAKVGARMPRASTEAAVHFLQTYSDPDVAWSVLTRWAGTTYLLTVNHDSFRAAHASALRYLRRAEEPERDDIDVVLPLAWAQGANPRVVRVTFSRPSEDPDPS